MRKIAFIAGLMLSLSYSGIAQEQSQNEPNRLKLVPVERNVNQVPANTTVKEERVLTREEKIQNLEEKITSIESKIEVLTTEDAQGNAAEIIEKKTALEKYKLELQALKEGQN